MTFMEDIIRQVSEKLIKCYFCKTSLRFPNYRNKSNRISEQESKFFFSIVFEQQKSPFSFSIEVPTDETYNFSGKKSRSALHDLAIYDENHPLEFKWIIELKSKQPRINSIKKDFEKMIGAKCNCVWFHTLENTDSGTIPALLKKFYDVWEIIKFNVSIEKKWEFAIVVLKQKKLYRFSLKINKSTIFPKNIMELIETNVQV